MSPQGVHAGGPVTAETAVADRVLGDYRANGAYDELVGPAGAVREHWAHLATSLDALGLTELQRRSREVARLLRNDGVTYHVYGGPAEAPVGTAWPLDPIPLLMGSEEWRSLEEGLIERADLLNLVLADIYGPRDLVRRGLIPPEVVYGHRGFLRACDGLVGPGSQPLFTYAADIARDPDGAVRVLSDFSQAPSGAGYALENRTVISRVFPSLYRDSEVHRLAPFFRVLRASLAAAAPAGVDDPRVVLLTPGPLNEAYFEHAHLATVLGYPLVQGGDLTVRDGRVWLRSLGGLEPVDVILRRVDGWYCDPLELKGDSQLGIPGLVEACRKGTVSVVNPMGSSVLENPGLLPFLPAVARHLLGHELGLAATPTWWCGDEASRSHVLAHLDHLVVKPIGRKAGRAALFGADLSAAERDDLVRTIEQRPWAFVGQEMIDTATAPTLGRGGVEARHSLLRTFAVARDGSYAVMPGGLTRVAPEVGSRVVSNQAGAVSKDTWVLASEPEQSSGFWLRSGPGVEALTPAGAMPSRAAESLFWLGRYAARSEDTVRLMRATLDRRTDFQGDVSAAGSECLQGLLEAITHLTTTYPGFLGPDAAARANPEPELLALTVDARRPGTLAFSLGALLNAANAARDQLSGDTWLVLSSIERELEPLRSHNGDLHASLQAALAGVLRGLLALSGISMESMVRDPGWSFMDLGRRLERALMLTWLLRSTLATARDTAAESLMMESVLISAESIITYRRRYRSQAQLETLLDLVLLDPDNPRSLRYQLDRIEAEVAGLPRPPDSHMSVEEKLVLELSTRVRLADTVALAVAEPEDGRRAHLLAFLDDVSDRITGLADSLELAHFTQVAPRQLGGSGEVRP